MRVVERLLEVLIFLAVAVATNRFDCGELFLGEIELALDDIGFAEIFAYLRIIRIERDGLEIIADALIDLAQFARDIAAIVQRLRSIRILREIEDLQRFLEAFRLGQRVSVVDKLVVREDPAMLRQAFLRLGVPYFAARASRQIGLLSFVTIGRAAAPASSSSSSTATPTTSSA